MGDNQIATHGLQGHKIQAGGGGDCEHRDKARDIVQCRSTIVAGHRRTIAPRWREPRRRGSLFSRPVSRILSRVTISLVQQPGPSAGRLRTGPVRLAPDGVWRAAVSPRRWWALTPPFHPCLRRLRRIAAGGLLSVPLSVGFRRLGRPSILPCGVRTFLEPLARPAVTRPASRSVAPRSPIRPRRAASSCTPGR